MKDTVPIPELYRRIQRRARQISARYPLPDFYTDLPLAHQFSRHRFDTDPVVRRLRRFVRSEIDDDFGHGMAHAVKVSLDAGALIITECRRAEYELSAVDDQVRRVHCAGLLHDIRRKAPEHAVAGARRAREVLRSYPLTNGEIEDISLAIRNHEAFKPTTPPRTPEGVLLSDCLYDADKFRWGPDNFRYTVWGMVAAGEVPLRRFVESYPNGMAAIARIKTTFRSETGRRYGPRFIEIGTAIGEELYSAILTEFSRWI